MVSVISEIFCETFEKGEIVKFKKIVVKVIWAFL